MVIRMQNVKDIIRRVQIVFGDKAYLRRLQTTDKKWLDESIETVTAGIIDYLESIT